MNKEQINQRLKAANEEIERPRKCCDDELMGNSNGVENATSMDTYSISGLMSKSNIQLNALPHEVMIATTERSQLFLRAVKSRKSSLKYLVYEKYNGVSDDLENRDGLISPYKILSDESSLMRIIQNLQGNYEKRMSQITTEITDIVSNRLLEPVVEDIDILSSDAILVGLKKWFEAHLIDNRVGIFEMQGKKHLALVRRGEKTPYKIFIEVMQEIAPKNKVCAMKDWLYRNDILVHDQNDACNDAQLTLSVSVIKELELKGDKCLSFNFGHDYMNNLYECYRREREAVRQNAGKINMDEKDKD